MIPATTLIDNAIALRSVLRENAGRVERERRLCPEVLDALHSINAFSLQVNESYGGVAADPITHLRVIEELSRGDASSGWCAMVGSEASSCVNAFLDPDTIRAMLQASDREVVGLTAVGSGSATASAGGYVVEGHWRFASGCRHSSWLGALCPVYDGDKPRQRENGGPVLRLVFAHASEVSLLDTWHTSGLRGTASDDFTLESVFIPEERVLDLFGPARDDAAVWRLPAGLRFAISKAAAVCGIARGAMDALYPLLERKPFAGALPAREEPRVQMGVAKAEAAIEGGRAYLYQNVAQAWDSVQAGNLLDLKAIAKVRLAVVFAANQAVEAVQLIQQLGGTASLFSAELDRAARDLNVARHHLQLQPHVVEDVGRVLLGLPPRNPMF